MTKRERVLLTALVDLVDECNGKLGQNPYTVPAFKAACLAACHVVGHKGNWMDGIDAARKAVQE